MSIPIEFRANPAPQRDPTAQDLAKEDKKTIEQFQRLLSDARQLTESKLDQYDKSGPRWATEEETELRRTAYDLRTAEDSLLYELKPQYERVSAHSGSPEDLKLKQLQFERYSEVLEGRIDKVFNDLGEPLRIIDETEQAVLDGLMRMRTLPLRA